MKLSALLALPADEVAPFYRGVLVDCESFTPPAGLREIAFRWPAGEADMPELLMDVIIAYGLCGLDILVEIPFENRGIDPAYLVSLAANADFSLALLPPESPQDASAYAGWVSGVAKAYLQATNFNRHLLPVSSYLEYMFQESVSDASDYMPSDAYVQAVFVDEMSPDMVDDFKAALRAVIHAHFGGEAGFMAFSHQLVAEIAARVTDTCRAVAESRKAGVPT